MTIFTQFLGEIQKIQAGTAAGMGVAAPRSVSKSAPQIFAIMGQ
jgi:hypothetical protein